MPVLSKDILRVAVRQKTEAQKDIVNVFEFEAENDAPAADADVLAAAATYFDVLYNTIEAGVPTAQFPYDLKVDIVHVVNGVKKILRNVGTVGWGNLYNPSDSGQATAPAVCALVLLRTTVGKLFGKKYLGGLAEAVVHHYSFEAGFLGYLANFITYALIDMVEETSGMVFTPGILSTSPDHAGQFLPFTDGEISPEPAYQRRRKLSAGS